MDWIGDVGEIVGNLVTAATTESPDRAARWRRLWWLVWLLLFSFLILLVWLAL